MEYKLGDLIEIKHGFAFKGKDFSETSTNKILLSPGNFLIGGGFNSSKEKYYSDEAILPEDYILKENDLIVTMTDLSKNGDTLGFPALIPYSNKKIFLHNQRLGRVTITKPTLIDKYYLYFLMRTQEYRHHVLSAASGTTVKHTSPSKILTYKVELPDLKLQKKIANILMSLENKLTNNLEIIDALEQISQTIFKRWFIDYEFPNSNEQPYKANGGEMIDSDLGNIPRTWRVMTLEESIEVIIDHRGKTPKKLGSEWTNDGIPAISAKNIKNNRLVNPESIKFMDEELYKKWMKQELHMGDIILTSEGPLGELYFLAEKEEYCLSQRLYGIRANRDVIYPEILFLFMNSPVFKDELFSRATGSTVQGIRQAELRKIKILIPDMEVQRKALSNFQSTLLQAYNLHIQNNKIKNLQEFLLPKLFSGGVVLPDGMEVNEYVPIS